MFAGTVSPTCDMVCPADVRWWSTEGRQKKGQTEDKIGALSAKRPRVSLKLCLLAASGWSGVISHTLYIAINRDIVYQIMRCCKIRYIDIHIPNFGGWSRDIVSCRENSRYRSLQAQKKRLLFRCFVIFHGQKHRLRRVLFIRFQYVTV